MTANDIRNIALLGHGGSGKTSLAEQMLFMTKGTDRLGKTADGNTTCDYDAEEIKRQISISLAFAPVNYKGVKINVMAAPGNFDFSGEALSAIRAAECAHLFLEPLFVERAHLLEQDYRILGEPAAVRVDSYMSGKIGLVLLAGYRCGYDSRAEAVADVVLNYQHRSYPALLGADDGTQIGVVYISPFYCHFNHSPFSLSGKSIFA